MQLTMLLLPTSLECPEITSLYIMRLMNLDLIVMVKLMGVTMLTLRLNVKHSTFAQLVELEIWTKYSFLCHNGTLFNQNFFICVWCLNFDCSTAEDFYSLKDEIAAEREALAEAAADIPEEYGALIEEGYVAAAEYPEYVASFSVAATQAVQDAAPVVPVAIVFKLRFPEPIGWCSVLSPIIAQDVAKDYPNAYIPEKKKVPGLFNYAEMDTEY